MTDMSQNNLLATRTNATGKPTKRQTDTSVMSACLFVCLSVRWSFTPNITYTCNYRLLLTYCGTCNTPVPESFQAVNGRKRKNLAAFIFFSLENLNVQIRNFLIRGWTLRTRDTSRNIKQRIATRVRSKIAVSRAASENKLAIRN